jgi:hypothetical protein
LLHALQPVEPGLFERLTSWMRRPAAWTVAGSVMAALVLAVALRQSGPPLKQAQPVVDMAKTEPAQAVPNPKPAEPAANAPAALEFRRAKAEPEALRDAARSEEKIASQPKDREVESRANVPVPPRPAPPLSAATPQSSVVAALRPPSPAPRNEVAAGPPAKLRVAVLDFDSGRMPAKEADGARADVGKTASDLLGKKLDSSGYTIIDRKQVDKALQEQNLSRRQLDASTAAGVGRSVGADAVIMGSVTQGQQAAQKSRGVVGGVLPAARSKTAAWQSEVQVTAQAINTQTAVNVGVAFGQGEQTPGGGLARAVDQVASSLDQQIQQNVRIKIDGLVTDVNATILTVNVGLKAGVKVGDRLEVRRAGKAIGRVVISTVKDSFSVGAFEGVGPAKIGDVIANQ